MKVRRGHISRTEWFSLGKQSKISSNTYLISERRCLPTLQVSFRSSFSSTVSKKPDQPIQSAFTLNVNVLNVRTAGQFRCAQLRGRCVSGTSDLHSTLFISLSNGLHVDESHLWELDLSAWLPVRFGRYPLKGY